MPDKKMQLTASMQMETESLVFSPDGDKQKAVVDIGGALYDDQGRRGASFTDKLTITAATVDQARRPRQNVVYTYQVYLAPGIYQMRIGARDGSSGKMGTAHQWIEIPNLASHKLVMSSLIAGERTAQARTSTTAAQNAPDRAPLRVDHRFHRNSFLRFLVYVYNATRAPADAQPDVAIQIQILRDQQPVVTTPLKKISTEGVAQLDQLPYAADISLEGLTAGQYVLQVTTIDRVAKSSAQQAMRFEIE